MAKKKKPAGTPPVAKFRENGLAVSVWERKTEKGVFHDVSFERGYKDADGKWHNAANCPTGQIQTLRKLLDMAHTEIMALRAGEAEAEDDMAD